MKTFFTNPVLLVSGASLWLFLSILSKASSRLNHLFVSSISSTISVIVYSLVSFFIMSFFFSGMIFVSKNLNEKNSAKFRDFFSGAKKFTIPHFLLLFLTVVLSIILGRVSHYLAIYLSQFLSLQIRPAQMLFLIIYFSTLALLLLFLSFSVFFLIIFNESIVQSIKSSARFVKRNYLLAISIETVLFVLFWISKKIPQFYSELIEYLLIIPLFALTVSYFIIQKQNDLRTS